MELDPDGCYRALTARDERFDGLFFVGVITTGIYCRPVCPARTPRRDRCCFFARAAEAEKGGYRACLRCRPELAPGHASVDAVSRTVRAALARIEAGAMNELGVDALAAELGTSGRQLRRALVRELGVGPIELAQTRRLLLARQLLRDTALPVTEVAFSSGFASLRRFNAVFRSAMGRSPSSLRRTAATAGDTLELTLGYRPPLAWDALLRFFAARATPGVESVDGECYRRTLSLAGQSGWIEVGPPQHGRLRLVVSASLARALTPLLARLRQLFDLDCRPDVIAAHLAADSRLPCSPGLRLPGAFDGFELASRAILGQQVSVRAATTLAGRFAAAFGTPIATPFPALTQISPTAAAIAEAGVDAIARLGIVAARARSLVALARAVMDGLRLEPGQDPAVIMAKLEALPGIGPWTAHVVAMRALAWPDAFPHGDLAIRKALGGQSARAILEMAEAWRPWRAYAALALWEI